MALTFTGDDALLHFLKCYPLLPQRKPKPVNPLASVFLERYSDIIGELYAILYRDMAPMGFLDKSSYSSFLDVILSCLYAKQLPEEASDEEVEEVQ